MKSNQGLTDKHRSGRPTKVTGVISAFIENKLEEDDEISSAELERLVARMFSVQISAPTIRRYIRMTLEWTVVRTRLGPMISERNKIKRHDFAKACIETGDTFNNVIWTDESSVQLTRHCRTMRVKVGKERVFKPAPKHALKVHVWAGISKRGATHICVFDQIMDGPLYVKILEDFLIPFLNEAFLTEIIDLCRIMIRNIQVVLQKTFLRRMISSGGRLLQVVLISTLLIGSGQN